METIKKTLRVNRMNVVFLLGFQLGFFLLGVAMVLVINCFVNHDADFGCMGTLLGLVGAAAGILARGNLTGKTRFSLAVTMGQTRKYALAAEALSIFALTVLGLAVDRVLYALEKGLYLALWPGFENGMPLDGFFRWWVLALTAAGVVVVGLFITAAEMRFGHKSFLIAYVVFIIFTVVTSRGMDDLEEGYGGPLAVVAGWIKRLILTVPPVGWAAIGAAAAAAMVAFSVRVYRTAEAKV